MTSREPFVWSEPEPEPERWPWRLRDQAVLTAEDHAEMLDLRERVLAAFGELGSACDPTPSHSESRACEPEAASTTEGMRPSVA